MPLPWDLVAWLANAVLKYELQKYAFSSDSERTGSCWDVINSHVASQHLTFQNVTIQDMLAKLSSRGPNYSRHHYTNCNWFWWKKKLRGLFIRGAGYCDRGVIIYTLPWIRFTSSILCCLIDTWLQPFLFQSLWVNGGISSVYLCSWSLFSLLILLLVLLHQFHCTHW